MQSKTNKKIIIFTGGGTAGHVTPNIALITKFLSEGWTVNYIGSNDGIEKTLITKLDIPYFAIASGKFRRYFSWLNFVDPFKIIFGIIQAWIYVLKSGLKYFFQRRFRCISSCNCRMA